MKWWEKGTTEIAQERDSAQLRSVSFRIKDSESEPIPHPQQIANSAGKPNPHIPEEAIELQDYPTENASTSTISPESVFPISTTDKSENQSKIGQSLRCHSNHNDVNIFTINTTQEAMQLNNSANPIANGVKLPVDYSSTSTLCSESPIQPGEANLRRRYILDHFSLISMGLGLGNIWRLPSLIFSNYPGETLIAYVILMIIIGLPILLLELTLGQFSSNGVIKTWQALPLLKGIGVAQLLCGFYLSLYYPSLMTWAFQFGVSGIGQWHGCPEALNLTICLCQTNCESYGNITIAEKCFEQEVLHSNSTSTSMNAKLLPMLAMAVIMISLCASFSARFMKVCVSGCGLAAAVLLSTSLALALTHPNNGNEEENSALKGIRMLNPQQLWAFGTGEVQLTIISIILS